LRQIEQGGVPGDVVVRCGTAESTTKGRAEKVVAARNIDAATGDERGDLIIAKVIAHLLSEGVVVIRTSRRDEARQRHVADDSAVKLRSEERRVGKVGWASMSTCTF